MRRRRRIAVADLLNKAASFLNQNNVYRTLTDPPAVYRFQVTIGPEIKGSFMKVTGIENEVQMEPLPEGGKNDGVHYLPTNIQNNRLILERGVMNLDPLEVWYTAVQYGSYMKLPGMIMLMDHVFWRPRKIWTFNNAYPVKYVGPSLDAGSSEVAVTRMEIIHDGLFLLPL